jgi:hypothetical protein
MYMTILRSFSTAYTLTFLGEGSTQLYIIDYFWLDGLPSGVWIERYGQWRPRERRPVSAPAPAPVSAPAPDLASVPEIAVHWQMLSGRNSLCVIAWNAFSALHRDKYVDRAIVDYRLPIIDCVKQTSNCH